MGSALNLLGERFGRLVVVERGPLNRHRKATWRCQCDCGRETVSVAGNLRSGRSTSCGCRTKERTSEVSSTHGMSATREYRIWSGMIDRCRRRRRKDFAHYGGRGIRVCERWQNSFEAFFADMGPRPSPAHSIDRIENEGDYEPDNCRWATKREQLNNTRRSRFVAFRGERMSVADAARAAGAVAPAHCCAHRLDRGWSVESAVMTPCGAHKSIEAR